MYAPVGQICLGLVQSQQLAEARVGLERCLNGFRLPSGLDGIDELSQLRNLGGDVELLGSVTFRLLAFSVV